MKWGSVVSLDAREIFVFLKAAQLGLKMGGHENRGWV